MDSSLPIIDVSRLSDDGPTAETTRLRDALHDVGFLYITGHGVDPAVTSRVFQAARQFFSLPLEDRLAIENVNSPHFRGYTRVGNEYTKGRADQRDQLDVGPEREALVLAEGDAPYLRMVGPNQWPASLPGFQEAVSAWFDEARRVSITLLRSIAVALGQPSNWFDPWFDDEAHDHLKVIRYPGAAVSIPYFLGPRLDAVVPRIALPSPWLSRREASRTTRRTRSCRYTARTR